MRVYREPVRILHRALVLLLIAVAVFPKPVRAGSPSYALQETVISVSDLDSTVRSLRALTGWKVISRGPVDRRLLQFWKLPESVSAREVVLGLTGLDSGFLRVVEFAGIERRRIRPSAYIWDTGGIFDFNFWTKDLYGTFAAMRAAGWHAFAEPEEYRLTTYSGRAARGGEVIVRGPDDIVVALSARFEPELEDWPAYGKASHVYTVTQTVRDFDAARNFYRDILGFRQLSDNIRTYKPGPNLFGMPQNQFGAVTRRLGTFDRAPTDHPMVKIMSFYGAAGVDHAAQAKPPNLGVMMIRLKQADVSAYAEAIVARGARLENAVARFTLAPYGEVAAFAVQSPEGAWIEFFEPLPR
jgi:catechol 2,3-dioxygenase-like lactoylglutathione lyase family enzyme